MTDTPMIDPDRLRSALADDRIAAAINPDPDPDPEGEDA